MIGLSKRNLGVVFLVVVLIVGIAFWRSVGGKNAQGLERDVIAVIGTKQITQKDFDEQWKSMPPDLQEVFKDDKEELLENIIVAELLYQEAKRQGIVTTDKPTEEAKKRAISEMLQKLIAGVSVTEEEIRSLYDKNPQQLNGAKLEDVHDQIKEYILAQKQGDAMDTFINEVRKRTAVVKNEDWLNKINPGRMDSPFAKLVKNGRPTVLDLGSNTCVPCKMMKPIFDELEKEYTGKANIVVLEIGNNRDLARQYRVRVIPTQIFFDKEGNEYWRHEGYMPKEEIIAKLKALGVN